VQIIDLFFILNFSQEFIPWILASISCNACDDSTKKENSKYIMYQIIFISLRMHLILTLFWDQTSFYVKPKRERRLFLLYLSSISFSCALSQLPRYVLLLIWRLWHFNFHLTRLAYIIFIIQANLLAATCPPLFRSRGHFKRTESPWRRRWVAFAGGFIDCTSFASG